MRKIIQSLSTITGSFPKYNLGSYIAKAREAKIYHAQQRVERKLLLLKRATLLSYLSMVCSQELRASLQFATRDRLIDHIICNGLAEDCASAYEIR
jgi:hypothetical protein